MAILQSCSPFLQSASVSLSLLSRQKHYSPPVWAVGGQTKSYVLVCKAGGGVKFDTQKESEGEDGGFGEDGFSSRSGFVGRGEGKEFDRDPEFAEIMGACLDDPQKARSKVSLTLH